MPPRKQVAFKGGKAAEKAVEKVSENVPEEVEKESEEVQVQETSVTRSTTTDAEGNVTSTETVTTEKVIYKKTDEVKKGVDRSAHYRARTSRLDYTADSDASKSDFVGFFNLAQLGMAFYIIVVVCNAYFTRGYFFKYSVFEDISENIFWTFFVVICMCIVSYTAVLLQKLIIADILPLWMVPFFQHGVQSLMIGTAAFLTLYFNFGVTQNMFITLETLVLFMKMHAYTSTNCEFATEWREKHSKTGPITVKPCEAKHGALCYPANVTLRNYFYWLCIPTLCYELEYPSTKSFRLGYLLTKLGQITFGIACAAVTTNEFILPVLRNVKTLPLHESVIRLIVPVMLVHVMMFFIIFECILNAFAELTCFADREFYEDWWNSTTFEEYARKWNKPVHHWLLRHVYQESRKTYRLSRSSATFATFLFSSLLHEMIFIVVLGVFRPGLFFMQMFQLPLIYMGRYVKGTRLGNYVFWLGLYTGPPLLSISYCIAYFKDRI
eukprot:Colp12_sorted_trinity150504_noHs@6343